MKCINKQFIAVNPNDPVHFFEFEEFESIPTKSEYLLIPGGHNWSFFENYAGTDVVIIYFEEPNCFIHGVEYEFFKKYDSKIRKIYTICPFSANYLNKIENRTKREFVWIPFNLKYIPPLTNKTFDVFYSGHCHNVPFNLNVLNNYIKCIVSFNGGTHSGVDYVTKLKLNSQSKISIVHNLLIMPQNDLSTRYTGHEGLSKSQSLGIAPQLKNRCIEAAASRSLMLCKYDDWKLIESQFTPDKDFIYWYNEDDLRSKIDHVLSNYDQYQSIIHSAYHKIINQWSTRHFFNQFLKNI